MASRDLKQVDVFADEPFAGNPVAVVADANGPTNDEMQRIARVALDCSDQRALAEFYPQPQLPDFELDDDNRDWIQLRSDAGAALAFQRAPHHQPPIWPITDQPQQRGGHLDFRRR